tara:strand:+ start:352 stop:459 length:108 start_codon:yes stop_codon:yes gene_type:complete
MVAAEIKTKQGEGLEEGEGVNQEVGLLNKIINNIE